MAHPVPSPHTSLRLLSCATAHASQWSSSLLQVQAMVLTAAVVAPESRAHPTLTSHRSPRMPRQPRQPLHCSLHISARSSPRAFAPAVPTAENALTSPLYAAASSFMTWSKSRSSLAGQLGRFAQTIHTKFYGQALSLLGSNPWPGRRPEVGTEELSPQHWSPAGRPAGNLGLK